MRIATVVSASPLIVYFAAPPCEAKYYNLQFTIYQTLNSIRFLKEMASQVGSLAAQIAELPSETFRMAMAMVTMGPIILAYPFFQKYFVKGVMLGSLKG